MKTKQQKLLTALTAAVACFLLIPTAAADQVIPDDLIVQFSACVGFDCVNGESFGFDTIRLKENNLRIKAQDTSNTASFPTQDWSLTFNDSANGGLNKFSIEAISPNASTPFTIEAGGPATNHALYVDDSGRVGFGTNNPVLDLHVKTGNTPALRLEQDGTSGFTAQTWDIAGNEANFFVRDVTGGSTLPFRIRPGAPTSSIDIASDGDVRINAGSQAGNAKLEVSADGLEGGLKQLALCDTSTGNCTQVARTDNDTFVQMAGTGTYAVQLNGTSRLLVRQVNSEFNSNLNVVGTLSKGGGAFRIDHPLYPKEKYLQHSFVESPDMMNVYNGNIVLDENGEAVVTLENWFETLNRDFRYQLTSVGGPGPGLYVAEKVSNNRFRIAGGTPGLEVSWQVTGVRDDPYAQVNRIATEVQKPEAEVGTYLHPEAYAVVNAAKAKASGQSKADDD
jgi:hypothetical protein